MERVNAVQFSISSESPGCNPIENLFNLVERKLQTIAPEQNIQHEPYLDLCNALRKQWLNFQ